jgi:hypothetical protein
MRTVMPLLLAKLFYTHIEKYALEFESLKETGKN